MTDITKNDDDISEKMKELFMQSLDFETAEAAYKLAVQEGNNIDITFTDLQKLSIASHVSAMINRSKTGSSIPSFDIDLFSDVPINCLEASRKIVMYIGNLPDEESYLLSIHFAGAKIAF